MKRRISLLLRTLFPRIFWTVVERDGVPELVIWREWLGSAYDIRSIAGSWGRWDRTRIARSRTEAPAGHPVDCKCGRYFECEPAEDDEPQVRQEAK